MEASHTKSSVGRLRILPELGLVDLSDPGLSGRLAGRVSEQLEVFSSRMREGLLAASVAIGGQARPGPRRVPPRH
jgi:hypothetical protein